MRVLLVEGDSDIIRSVGSTLAGSHALRVCDDGASVWRMVDEEDVDLLMLDVDLKGCDAVDTCRTIRGKDSTNHRTTVIVIADRYDLMTRLLAFSAGADDWLEKPIESRELRTRLDRWAEPALGDADLAARRSHAVRGIVRSMGHELNNPLGAAVMGVDLVLRRGNLPADSARDLGVVRDNLDRISAILTNFQTVKDRTLPTA